MPKRTIVEIDEQFLARGRRALGSQITRATEQSKEKQRERATRQRQFLASLDTWLDLEVLASEQMWR